MITIYRSDYSSPGHRRSARAQDIARREEHPSQAAAGYPEVSVQNLTQG